MTVGAEYKMGQQGKNNTKYDNRCPKICFKNNLNILNLFISLLKIIPL
jgi:hypothetical protein